MIPETQPGPIPVERNRAARRSLVGSILLLIPTLVILASNSFSLSPGSKDFFRTNPDHPLVGFCGLVFEITFLFLPVAFLSSLIVISQGARGIRTSDRLPNNIGFLESEVGIGLALLVMTLSVVGFFQWGSAFRQ